jgi:hypothetical protein
MWYISFGGGSNGVKNIRVYHNSGRPHAKPDLLPTGKFDPRLEKLRSFVIAGSLLYVVNAYHSDSKILVYATDENGDYRFKAVFAAMAVVNALFHPYDLTFDSQGNCYVSCQDTNLVTGLNRTGGPLAVAAYLQRQFPPPQQFLAGTFVASALGALPGIQSPPPPDVVAPQGLEVTFTDPTHTRIIHSVRGVVFHKGHLFVADEPANAVKVYDGKTGEFRGQIAGHNLRAPDQLLLDATTGVLYIGSSESDRVVSYDLAQGTPSGTVQPRTFIHGGVNYVSGMAIDPEGYFYVAERKAKRIRKFPPNGSGSGTDFISDLPDEPEFIRYVPKR